MIRIKASEIFTTKLLCRDHLLFIEHVSDCPEADNIITFSMLYLLNDK